MGLLDRFRTDAAAYAQAYRSTSGLENPSSDLVSALSAFDDGGPTASGFSVSPDSALRNVAVYAAVRVLAESVGSLPVHVYKREGNSRVRVEDDRERLLSEAPNDFQTAETFWTTLVGHANLYGNGYVLVSRSDNGRPEALWLLDPRSTAPYRRRDGSLYFGSYVNGHTVSFDPADVIHIRGFGTGDVGISPIGVAREALGEAAAAQDYAGRFFSNSAVPGGIITYPRKLDDATHREASKRWAALHQGGKRAHFVATLDNGAEWQSVGIPAKDSQFLEMRQFGVRAIARLFRVPPHMIGDLEGTVTYASIETQALDFVRYSLTPWVTRCEQAISRCIFSSDADRRAGIYPKFALGGLLRGDTATRYAAYAVGRQWGFLSTNDVRQLEDLPSLGQAGDDYLTPLNMTGVDPEKLAETARHLQALDLLAKRSEAA